MDQLYSTGPQMDVKRAKPLILRRDAVEGRMVARHIALEKDPSPSPTDQTGAGVEVCGEEIVIQLESDMLPIGAELQMDMASSNGLGSQPSAAPGNPDGPPGSWFEPLGEDDVAGEVIRGGNRVPSCRNRAQVIPIPAGLDKDCLLYHPSRRAPRRKWRRPVDEDEDWDDCSALGPGWKRKAVFRQSSMPARRRWDTYYSSPDGYRVRSKVELAKYFSGGVDLTHFDFSSGLFLDEKNGLKHLNHVEEVHSSSTSTSVTGTPRTGTPDIDRNHNPKRTPGTPQQSLQNQVNFLHVTQSPTVSVHDILLATDRLSPSVRPPSLRRRSMAITPSGGDAVVVRRSSLLPLSPAKNDLSQLGLQTVSPAKNDLSQLGLQTVSPAKNDLSQLGLQTVSPAKNDLSQLGLQTVSPAKKELSQLGLQIPERHRKVVVVLRPDLDLDPITCPPPRHLALVNQWTQQFNGSKMSLNGHKELDMEESPENPQGPPVKRSYAEKIQHLKMANQEDAAKKPSPSIVFRKLPQGLVSVPVILLAPCGEKRQRKEHVVPLTDIEVGDDKWVLGGKQLEVKEEEVDNSSTTSLYNKKNRKKFDRDWTNVTRRASISRKVKMKATVKDLDEEADQHQKEVVPDEEEEEEEEEEDEEEEEEEEEREEKPLRRIRTLQQKVKVKEETKEDLKQQKKKIRVKEKEDEEEWRPNKIVNSDGSETDERTEMTNIPYKTGKLKRSQGCGTCAPCQRSDCDRCIFCMDKPRNGGLNRKKQKCKYRRCLNMPTKKDLRTILYKKRKGEQYGPSVLISPGPGRVTNGPGDIPEIGLGGLPGSVPVGPAGIPLGTGVSVLPGAVARHPSEYFIFGKKRSQWHSLKSGSEHTRGRGRGRGKGRGRPPKRSQWSNVPLSDTPATDDTDEDEGPVYFTNPLHLEEEEGEDGGVWRELQERDNDQEGTDQIIQMSPSCMPATLSNGVFGSEEAYISSSSQPYPQSCYQGDHGNLKVIRMNGHQITSIIPGPTLASSAMPVIYPAPEDYLRSEPPSIHYLRSEPPPVNNLRSEPPSIHYLRSEPPSIHYLRSEPPPVNNLRSEHPSIHYLRSEPPSIHYLRSEPPPVNNLRSEPPSVHYLRSEPPSVHYLRSEPPPVNNLRSEPPSVSSMSPSRTPSGGFPPGYTEELQLVELYAEVPRTIINLGAPDPSEFPGSKVTSRLTPEVEDFNSDEITPVITDTFSLAVGPESGGEDRDAELFGFLRALRRTVLPAHWVGVMAHGPLLQLLQCSKLSTMADTVLQIQPGFCYQVTVQGQPLLLTHPLYDAHPPRLTSIPQLVTLLLDLETRVVCPGFPVPPPPPWRHKQAGSGAGPVCESHGLRPPGAPGGGALWEVQHHRGGGGPGSGGGAGI
uniref:Methyl-CpG binding domain protein 1b n=1 Tax=Esox lucius TaxID=8010 RepID=A0A6Q2YA72_ESOLU